MSVWNNSQAVQVHANMSDSSGSSNSVFSKSSKSSHGYAGGSSDANHPPNPPPTCIQPSIQEAIFRGFSSQSSAIDNEICIAG